MIGQRECNGGGFAWDVNKHVWRDTINPITVPGSCNDWAICLGRML